MIKLWKRLSSKEFQVMFTTGVFFTGKKLTIVLKKDFKPSHVGFTIKRGKKSSVQRNYYKRQLREAFKDVQSYVPDNWSIILILNPSTEKMNQDHLRFELLSLLDTAKSCQTKTNENTPAACY